MSSLMILAASVFDSVVTVAGICNSVGGGVFSTCHRGAGAGGNIGGCQG